MFLGMSRVVIHWKNDLQTNQQLNICHVLARPSSLDDFIGQTELVGPGGILRALVLQDTVPSIILWGPCGVGKTTLARIIAHTTKAQFKEMGATTHGVADVRYNAIPLCESKVLHVSAALTN